MTRDEADVALAQAIADQARAYGNANDEDLLNDFAVIAHWALPDGDTTSCYTTAFHRASVPAHITEGLFRVGVSICCDQSWSREGED